MQIISNKKWDAFQQTIKSIQQSNLSNMARNLGYQIFPNWLTFDQQETYQTMDDVYSVIKKLAVTSAMIPFYGYDKAKDTDLPDNDKLSEFLLTLDFEQKEIMYTYLYYAGEVFMYKNRLEEGVNAGLTSVSFLNPARMTLTISTDFPARVVSYKYFDVTNGLDFEISIDDIVFIKLFNPSTVANQEWRGLSPISVLSRRLTRVTAAENATVAQMQNGGTPGIVYDKSPNLSAEVIGQRRDNFGRFIKNSENKGAPYFSANDLGYIQLGTPLADMDVAAMQSIDFDKICNAYGVSSVLFNNKSASTESNVQEMVKEMYTSTVLPNVTRIQDAINKFIVPEIKTKGEVQADTSEIKSLHQETTRNAQALAGMYWLTGNEKREILMYGRSTDPMMDEFIIPSGFMKMDDLAISVAPIPNAAGDYTAPAKKPTTPAKKK